MSKPETTFYTGVHGHLPSVDILHREKMSNPYRGGTADHWYSGKQDLWVEWKFIIVPKLDTTMIDLCGGKKPTLSHLQQDWLKSRYNEGRSVLVIVGSAKGGVVYTTPLAWSEPITALSFRKFLQTRKEIAEYIIARTNA